MKKHLVTFVFLFLVSTAEGQAAWSTTTSGCGVANGTFNDHESQVSFVLLRCDPKRVEIRLVDSSSAIGKANSYAAFSLRELLEQTRASIVVNAGSTSSYSVPAPAGLLMIQGRLVGRPALGAENAVGFGGVLCIRGDQISIEEFSWPLTKQCQYAVQRGPILSRDFANDNKSRYRRTVVAVDAQGRLLVMVTKQVATLLSISSFLYSQADLAIRSALNLDGDVSSGLMFADDQDVKDRVFGTVDGLIASAITIRGPK